MKTKEEFKCICSEGIHNGNEIDCACECHKIENEIHTRTNTK